MISLKNYKLDLEILLSYVLKVDRSFLIAHPETVLSRKQLTTFCKLVARRLNHEPIAYLTCNKHFWDLNFLVTKHVLIPRPETEILVEQALATIPVNSSAKILELGTGSGAIALSIAKHRPNTIVYATDYSNAALKIAKKNAKILNINNVRFFSGDWFNALPTNLDIKFDIILSNPPYIAKTEVNLCDQEIFYEPKIALFATNNGLACLKKIIINSRNYLNNNGYLLLEHGCNQTAKIVAILNLSGLVEVESIKDLSGKNRVIIAKYHKYS